MLKERLIPISWNPTADCASQHFGLWCIEPRWISDAVAALRAGMCVVFPAKAESSNDAFYSTTPDGIALVRISGQIMKGFSKFGGTNSIMVRRALTLAANDPAVNGMMMVIDSPGGTVAGTDDAAKTVRMFAQRKPLYVQAEDLMASAAYWIGSQADYVAATQTTEVGSIGVMAVVYDTSGMYAKEGIKVHVMATGEQKGAGVDGTEVLPKHLEAMQQRVDDVDRFFKGAVMAGMGLSQEQMAAASSGDVWIAERAKSMGLIDAVQDFGATYHALVDEVNRRKDADANATQRRLRLAVAKNTA